MAQEDIFKKLVAHCKEYGYVFQSSEIYDGLAAVYDYGQYGVELKNNIKKYWWDSMVFTKLVASTRLSCVPVSSQVNPCPNNSTFKLPFSR